MKAWQAVGVMVVVVVMVASQAAALQCHQCVHCQNNPTSPTDCPSQSDACVKIAANGYVQKSCWHKAACDFSKLREDATNAWNNIKNIFANIDQTDISEMIHCCYTDGCNPATIPALHPALALLSPLLLLVLRR